MSGRLRRKIRWGLAGLAFAALALPAVASGAVHVTGVDTSHFPTIRATVLSSSGSAVRPSLTENGVPVAELQATNLASSKSVVLAIDRSRSMRGRSFADAISAAQSFCATKPATDRISVVGFASGVRSESRFSVDPSDCNSALSSLAIDSVQGTALYDAVSFSARRLSGQDGGRVLILLTDGTDTTSKMTLDATARLAREQNVLVYPIAIAGPSYDPTALQRLARDSGGTFYRASSSSALAGVYSSIARALRNTWRVQYLTAARPGDRIHLQAAAAGAGTGSTSTQIPARFGTPIPGPSKLVPQAAYGPSGALAIGLAVAALVLLATILVFAAARGSWVRSRIAAHIGESRSSTKRKRRDQRMAALTTMFQATERALGHLKQWRWIQRMLERADLPLRTAEFFWITLGCGFGLALLAAVAGQPAFIILLFLCAGLMAPLGFVWMKMRRRLRAFEDQLPDLLITIAASLKAGHSFKQGLQAVVDEGQPPASDELNRVLTETSLGRPMDEALADMAERAGSANFEFAMTAVTIQRQVGGSLASLFDMVADTVRQRQQFARKIKSLTAMGKMSAYVLVGVPFFMAAAITLLNPTYMHPLFYSHAGRLLLIGGLVMIAIGSALLKKIVSFRG